MTSNAPVSRGPSRPRETRRARPDRAARRCPRRSRALRRCGRCRARSRCGSSDRSASSRQPEPVPRSRMRSGAARSAILASAASTTVSLSGRGTRTAGLDLERQAPELARAQDIGHRLAGQPARRKRREALFLGRAQASAAPATSSARLAAGRGRKQQPGLAARVLDAGRRRVARQARRCAGGGDALASDMAVIWARRVCLLCAGPRAPALRLCQRASIAAMSSGSREKDSSRSEKCSHGWADCAQTSATGSSQPVSSSVPGFRCQYRGPSSELW